MVIPYLENFCTVLVWKMFNQKLEGSPLSTYLRKSEKYLVGNRNTACLKDISSLSKDMSLSGVWRDQMEAERNVNRLRNCLPEKFEAFCNMHLSFLLDCSMTELDELFGDSSSKHKDPIKKKAPTPFSKKKESLPLIGNRFLTREQVAQIYQLSEFLQRPENIRTEGLFRKTGNLARQRLLKEWVNQGANLRLDDGLFSAHDCANVLKNCISELPEPLLTEKHFQAHCQIADMSNNVTPGEDRSKVKDKQIKALQLLFLLIPRQNAVVLECLLDLLHKVSNVSENLMTAHSLGMVFAPSLICPKKLTSMELHSMSELFTKAVSLMIESTPFLFKIPRDLAVDVGNFWREMEEPHKNVFTEESVPQYTNVHLSIQKAKHDGAKADGTVITFAERKYSDELESSQETQETQERMYAHIQATPKYSSKKKLLKQFNRGNGNSASKGKHSRSRSFGDSIKKHFSLLNKHKPDSAFDDEVESCDAGLNCDIKKIINFDSKELMSTYVKTPEKIIGEIAVKSIDTPAVHIVDLMTCLQLQQTCKEPNTNNATLQQHEEDKNLPQVLTSIEKEPDYIFEVVLIKNVTQQKPTAVVSPITQCIKIAPKSTQMALMTPRSRTPIMLNFPMKYLESDL